MDSNALGYDILVGADHAPPDDDYGDNVGSVVMQMIVA